jgi:hypothetical protein
MGHDNSEAPELAYWALQSFLISCPRNFRPCVEPNCLLSLSQESATESYRDECSPQHKIRIKFTLLLVMQLSLFSPLTSSICVSPLLWETKFHTHTVNLAFVFTIASHSLYRTSIRNKALFKSRRGITGIKITDVGFNACVEILERGNRNCRHSTLAAVTPPSCCRSLLKKCHGHSETPPSPTPSPVCNTSLIVALDIKGNLRPNLPGTIIETEVEAQRTSKSPWNVNAWQVHGAPLS